MGKITLRVLFGDSTADATRISPSLNGREIAVQSFLATIPSKIYYYCDFFFKCSISNRSSSKFFAERHVCIASRSALWNASSDWFIKIEQSGKPTSEKMTSHGSVSDLPADIVSVDRVLIRLAIEKTIVFLFLLIFLLSQYRFSILINLISLVTTTFSRPIRNTVLQLSPVISSDYKIWAVIWDFQQYGILTWIGTGEPVQPPFKNWN